jgi:hypothetical protein
MSNLDKATETVACPKCGQRVAVWALPTPCSSCGRHLLDAKRIYLRPMAASFVVAYAYHAEVGEWDGSLSGETVWTCDHEHEEVEQAVECGRQYIANPARPGEPPRRRVGAASDTPTSPKFKVGDLVRFKKGRIVWRLAKIHGRGISGELWKGPTAWNSRQAFFSQIVRAEK